MLRNSLFILFLSTIPQLSFGQFINRYGFNLGTSYAIQNFVSKVDYINISNQYKHGFQAFIQAEKDLNKSLAIRTEIGYIQKGNKSSITITSVGGRIAEKSADEVNLRNIALNLGLKFTPFDVSFSPYLIAGLRSDFMASYENETYIYPGGTQRINLYQQILANSNEFNLGGLFALGVNLTDLFYVELEYNPNFTNTYSASDLELRNITWGAKIGLNLNNVFN